MSKPHTDTPKTERKVLIVDDDPMISEIIDNKLTSLGYHVLTTTNSAETLFLVERHQPDLIILDLMMSKMSGEEVLQHLQASEAYNHIPVLVFSNQGDAADLNHVLELGADQFLVKANTSLEKLAEVVGEMMTA